MRKVIAWNLISLDGFFEGPKKWDLDWHLYVWGEELERLSLEQLASADALLFGRVTYQGMAEYWTTAEGEIADGMNRIPKVVFSNTLDRADWNETTLVKGRAEDEVVRLKQQPGKNLFVFGSADLCASLLRRGLIDEVRLGVVPVVLGDGTPLFKPAPERIRLELVEASPLSSGCVVLRYRPHERS